MRLEKKDCPRLGEAWDPAYMFNHATFCMCLSQVRSLYFSGCRLLVRYIFVFRLFFVHKLDL